MSLFFYDGEYSVIRCVYTEVYVLTAHNFLVDHVLVIFLICRISFALTLVFMDVVNIYGAGWAWCGVVWWESCLEAGLRSELVFIPSGSLFRIRASRRLLKFGMSK